MNYDDMRDWMRAEAGDTSPRSHVFVPGVDFDPSDEDDVCAVMAVGERDRAEAADYWRERALRAERAAEARDWEDTRWEAEIRDAF